MRFRLLPVLIFAGAALLTVRAGDMWQQVSLEGGQPSFAESATPAEGTADGVPADSAPAGAHDGAATPAEAANDAAASANPENPFDYSDSEIELLQSLAARRDALDAREAGLAEREALIAAAEKRMDEKLVELKAVETQIRAALSEQQATAEQMASLVKIYETMKPKDAARIFNQLDFAVLIEVLGGMREAKSAPILAAMDPGKAKLVTVALAARSGAATAAPTLAAAPAPAAPAQTAAVPAPVSAPSPLPPPPPAPASTPAAAPAAAPPPPAAPPPAP
ncbi:MAG: MotE family protein [Dongiaceae bacterium]